MHLYLIENNLNKTRYIGLTKDLERRLKEHNSRSKHFTSKINGKWKVIGFKEFKTFVEARKEELRLKKSKNRRYVEWYFGQH